MKKLFILCSISIFLSASAFTQVTHLESYYEGQGGIEGIVNPNCIVTDSSGQNLFITATNCITHLTTDTTFSTFAFKEKVIYSSSGFSGLWNVDQIATNRNNKCFYATGDQCLYVFSKTNLTDSFHLEQSFFYSVSLPIGGAVVSQISIPPDNKNLYVSTSYGGLDNILIFSMDSVSGSLTYIRKFPVEDVKYVTCSNDNKYLYTLSSGSSENSIGVYKRITDTNDLILVHNLTTINGINHPTKIVASKDSKNVYVYDDPFIRVYDVDTINGTLSFNQELNIDSCFSGFWYAKDIILSNDNQNLYIAGMYDVSVYSRDTLSGHLTFTQVIQEGQNNFSGFNNLYSITITKSDSILYVVSKMNNSILVFLRNATTGLLSYHSTVTNEDGKIKGLNSATNLTVSNDCKHVYYVAYGGTNCIGIFEKLPDGRLQYIRAVKWNELGPEIGATYFIEMSPDDKNVIIGSTNMYGLRILKRNTNNGNLVFYKSYTEPGIGLSETIRDFAFTSDQHFFYVSTYSNILTYSVDPDSTDLTFVSGISSSNVGVFGLEGINSITASNDNKNIYTSAVSNFSPDGISVYERNAVNGSLSVIQNVLYTAGLITNFAPSKVILSPDNKYLYSIGSAIHCFKRDTSDGRLTFLYQINISDLGIYNVNAFDDASISNDGKSFIGITRQGKSIVSLYRNAITGDLLFEESEKYSDDSDYASTSSKICITSDVKNAYIIQQYDNLLAAYKLKTPIGLSTVMNGCGNSVILTVDEGYSCSWSNGDTTNSIIANSDGQYSVYVVDTIGREGWDTTNVILHPLPLIDLGNDTTLYLSDIYYLIPYVYGLGIHYLWNDSTTLGYKMIVCSGYGIGDQVFTLSVTDANGCSSSDSIKISIINVTSIAELNNDNFKLYPNPTTGELIIESPIKAEIEISNVKGRIIQTIFAEDKKISVDLKNFSSGIYIIKIKTDKGIIIKKVVKE